MGSFFAHIKAVWSGMRFFNLISPMLFIGIEVLLCGWAPYFADHKQQTGLTFKHQLQLEAQFHPSFMIRTTLYAWQKIIETGQSHSYLTYIIPWALPPWAITLDDFYEILKDIAMQHPAPLPFGSLIRFFCVYFFSKTIAPVFISSGELFLIVLPVIGLIWETWCWGSFKQLLIVLRWWQRSPGYWTKLGQNGVPEPIFLTSQSDKKLWHQMWALEPDLMITSQRFASYFLLLTRRKHQRMRQLWCLLLDVSTLWLFSQMTSTLLQSFYYG